MPACDSCFTNASLPRSKNRCFPLAYCPVFPARCKELFRDADKTKQTPSQGGRGPEDTEVRQLNWKTAAHTVKVPSSRRRIRESHDSTPEWRHDTSHVVAFSFFQSFLLAGESARTSSLSRLRRNVCMMPVLFAILRAFKPMFRGKFAARLCASCRSMGENPRRSGSSPDGAGHRKEDRRVAGGRKARKAKINKHKRKKKRRLNRHKNK